jgi:hypothetical protein
MDTVCANTTWVLAVTRVDEAISVAHYLKENSGIDPIIIVDILMRSPALTVSDEYVTVAAMPEINWPGVLCPANTISAPVFIFHLLFDRSTRDIHAFWVFLWETRSATTITECAVSIVGCWFRDAMFNPPLLDTAMRIGHADTQQKLAVISSGIRVCFDSLSEYTAAINAMVSRPWNLTYTSVFYKLLIKAIKLYGMAVAVTTVRKPPALQPDVVMDNGMYGVIFGRQCDRLVTVLMVLFSPELALSPRWKTESQGWRDTAGIPPDIASFLHHIHTPRKLLSIHHGSRESQ